MPDGETLVQSQPIYRCAPGGSNGSGPLLMIGDYIQGGTCHNSTPLCRATSILSTGNESMWGSHGGSDISALGGSIRLGGKLTTHKPSVLAISRSSDPPLLAISRLSDPPLVVASRSL
jgi:hypothetical protein